MSKLTYQKIKDWKHDHRSLFTQDNPDNNRLKGGVKLDEFAEVLLIESAFKMSDLLDEIHKVVSSANGDEAETVRLIQRMITCE